MASQQAIDANIDYYELLGVEYEATTSAITKAYRKKALTLHPDKNPSPDAAVLFHKIKQAHEVLIDAQSRAAYDKRLKGRLERKKKQSEMDSKRRKAQEELEERERQAKRAKSEQMEAEAKYKAELAKLREEGAKRREEWREEPAPEVIPEPTELDCALKFKWKRKKHAFTEQDLSTILSPIGAVDTVALSEKKKGSAIVVFKTVVDAHAVITSKDTNASLSPFESIMWASGQEPAIVTKMNQDRKRKEEAAKLFNFSTVPAVKTGKPLFATTGASFFNIPQKASFSNAPSLSDKDYEAITFMKMREAERERLLQQIKQEDATTSSSQ